MKWMSEIAAAGPEDTAALPCSVLSSSCVGAFDDIDDAA